MDKAGSPTLLNCLMYKMSYYRFGEMQVCCRVKRWGGGNPDWKISAALSCHIPLPPFQLDFRTPPGFDRTRNAEIGNKDIKLKHLEEAFTSEHWLVRIYKVKKLENRDRVENKLRDTDSTKQKYTSKKVSHPLPKALATSARTCSWVLNVNVWLCFSSDRQKEAWIRQKQAVPQEGQETDQEVFIES